VRSTLAIGSLWLVVMCAVALSAQEPASGRQGRRNPPPVAGVEGAREPGVSPAEVQRMFDAYALMQAQEQLKIGDEQFAQFLTRYKALQDVRRKNLQERARLIVEMRQALNRPDPDEGLLKERMKTLQEIDARLAAEVKKAYDAIDQVLDVRQQAKFRVFEELMERRKLELVTRARQANRPKNQK
jgi:hypothetical protein